MKRYYVTNCNCPHPMSFDDAVKLYDDIVSQARRGLRPFPDILDDNQNVVKTVKELVEYLGKYLGLEYAQVVNCDDSTFRGVVMNQHKFVRKYQYDTVDNCVYIWI